MADVKSNDEIDLAQVSREGVNSTLVKQAPADQDPDAGPAVQQVLGEPKESKDSAASKST